MDPDARNVFAASGDHDRLSREEIAALTEGGRTRTCAPGEVIVEKGAAGDSMFFIVEGEVLVDLGPERQPKVMGAGSFFGELSFLDPSHPRSGTITSKGETRLFVLGPESAQALYEDDPRTLVTLLRRTCLALVGTEKRLVAELRAKNAALERSLDHLVRTREELDEGELRKQLDERTGLYNRYGFDAQLEGYVARIPGGRSDHGLALLRLELDTLDEVKARSGEDAGDIVVKQVARALRASIRRSDLPCWFEGAGFAVLLSDISEVGARRRAEQIRGALAALPPVDPTLPVQVTASIGGTLHRPGDTLQQFSQRAEEAVAAARTAGGDRVRWAAEV